MVKNGVEEINERRLALSEILQDANMKRKHLSRKDMLEELLKGGYKIELRTLEKDLESINSGNNFVLNLSSVNYSAYVQHIFEKLDQAEDDAFDIAKKEYNTDKTIHKEVPTKEGVIEVEETHETTPNPMPNIAALRLVKDIQECREKLLSGKIGDTAIAMMLKRHQELKKEVEVLKEENQSLKEGMKVRR